MKKVVILNIVLISCILISCGKNKKLFTITTDVDSYSPLMSSVQGITLSANTSENEKNLEFNWSTTEGAFINSKSSEDTGKSVVWIPFSLDETSSKSITVTLTVKNKNSDKEIAKKSILIEQNGIFYIVK